MAGKVKDTSNYRGGSRPGRKHNTWVSHPVGCICRCIIHIYGCKTRDAGKTVERPELAAMIAYHIPFYQQHFKYTVTVDQIYQRWYQGAENKSTKDSEDPPTNAYTAPYWEIANTIVRENMVCTSDYLRGVVREIGIHLWAPVRTEKEVRESLVGVNGTGLAIEALKKIGSSSLIDKLRRKPGTLYCFHDKKYNAIKFGSTEVEDGLSGEPVGALSRMRSYSSTYNLDPWKLRQLSVPAWLVTKKIELMGHDMLKEEGFVLVYMPERRETARELYVLGERRYDDASKLILEFSAKVMMDCGVNL